MARQKTSICLSCNTTFRSRRGAKTCSDRCRKRLQRANASVKKEAVKLEQEVAHVEQAVEQKVVQAEQAVEQKIEQLAESVVPSYATESGFVGGALGGATMAAGAQNIPETTWDPAPVRTVQGLTKPGQPMQEFVYPRTSLQGALTGELPPVTQQTLQEEPEQMIQAEDLQLQQDNQPQTASQPQAASQPISQVYNQPYVEDEPVNSYNPVKAIRQISRKLLATAVLAMVFAGVMLPFFFWPKSHGPVSQVTSDKSVVTPQLDGESIKLNLNTSVINGNQFLATGPVLIQSNVNSANAFRIQNSTGDNLLVANTKDKTITVGDQSAGNVSLNVNGDITTNGSLVSTSGSYSLGPQGLNIGGVLVCSAHGCVSSSSPSPTPTSPTIDVANVAFLNKNQTFIGNNNFTGQNSFNVTSTAAFQVQNSAGLDSLFMVDTVNNRIGIGTTPNPTGATLQIAGDLNVSSGIYRIGNTGGASLNCGPSQLLQQGVIQGGIITSGSCVTIAGGTIPTFQQVYDSSIPASFTLSNASGMLQIQDALSPLAGNLFEVTNNGASTAYFAVNNLGINVTGNVDTTGQYLVNGSQINSSNLANGANLAELNAGQTFTGANVFSNASNSFSGNGSGLTNVNAAQLNGQAAGFYTSASNISSGTLNDSRLSANVALLNATQTFSGNGNLFQNASNSTTAFRIQNAAGTSNLFIADTTNTRIGIGKAPTLGTLDVNGSIYQSGNQVCDTSGNCVGVGGGAVGGSGTLNKVAIFTGSGFTIGDSNLAQSGGTVTATGNLNVTGQYQVSGSQISSANLSNDSNLAKLAATQTFSGNGNLFQNASNSTTAFRIQNAAGTSNLLIADTTNTRIGIGKAPTLGTLDVNGSIYQSGNQVCDTSGNCVGVGGSGAIGGGGTANKIALFTGTGFTIGDSTLSQSGSTVTGTNLNVTGQYQVGGTGGSTVTCSGGDIVQNAVISGGIITGGSCVANAGSSSSLATTYNNGTGAADQTLALASGKGGGVIVKDAASTVGNLFTVQNNAQNVNYFNVTNAGISVSGTVTASGNIDTTGGVFQVNGSQISSANLSNDSNLAKLDASQTFSGNGNLFQNASNSATAFQIQNATGTSNLFIADTTNTRVGIGKAPTLGTLDVNGSIYQSGNQVCDTSGNCVGTGGGGSIGGSGTLNKIALFTGSGFSIGDSTLSQSGSTVTGTNLNVTGQYQVGGSQIASSNLSDSANLAKLNGTGPQTFTGNNEFTGTVLAQNTSNSTGAFQIQNSLGTSNLFIADTSHTRIAIAQATANYTLDVAGDINTTTGYRVAGTPGSGITCSSGQVVQNATIVGGIITGGSCVANGAGASTTLQNAYDNSASPATIATSSAAKGIIIKAGVSNDSTNLFRLQDAAGDNYIQADTLGANLYLGNTGITSTIQIGNTTGAVAQTINIGNNTTGSSTNTVVLGSTIGTSPVTIQAGTSGVLVKPANSTTAFQVQSATGGSLINVDSTNSAITLDGNNSGQLGQWATNANSLPAVRQGATSVVANGYVYEIGGCDSSCTAQSTVYYAKLNADGSTGAWTTNTNALPAVRRGASSVVSNGFVYVLAGDNLTAVGQSTVYYAKLNADGSTGAWQTNANALPQAGEDMATVVANGYVYAMGGSTLFRSTVYYARLNADGSTGAWQTNANALPQGLSGGVSIVANGYVYVMGGWNSSFTILSTVYYAKLNTDGSTGAWSTNANAIPQARLRATAVNINGYVYFIGGQNPTSAGSAQSTVYYAKLNADGSTGAWTTNTNALPGNRTFASSVVSNGYIYTIGGDSNGNASSAQSTVYYASTSRIQLGGNLDLVGLQGGTLSDPGDQSLGSVGGSITAGNGLFVGSLQVQGAASFAQGVGVTGNLTANGSALFQSSANSTNAFQIQTSTGSQALNVNTSTTPNLISNGDFESTINGWSGKGAGTLLRNDTVAIGAAFGTGSLAVTTTAAANDGASFNYTLAPTTTYTLSLYARSSAGTVSTINIGRQDVSGTDVDCLTGQSITTTFTRFICTFTTGGTITPPSSIYIKQSDATARTFYIDGVQLEQTSAASSFQANVANFQVQTATNTVTLDGSNSGALGPWSTNGNNLPTNNTFGTAVTANGYAYYIQGSVYYAKLNADGSTATWTTGNSLPTSLVGATSVIANGYVYVLGGCTGILNSSCTGSSVSTVYYAKLNADGSTGTWNTNTNSLPQTLYAATSVVANGYVYEIGGRNNVTSQSTVYYAKLNADGSTGTWTTNANALPSALWHATSVAANGYVYEIGGDNGGSISTVSYAKLNADGSTGTWSTASSLPAGREEATSVVSNGYIYELGGSNQADGTSDTGGQSTVYYAKLNADGSIGTWNTGASLLAIREQASSVSANGYVYILSGQDSSARATIYYASTSRIQLGGNLDLVGLQGGTLSDPGDQSSGSVGGSITAGNGLFVGSLQVQGQSSFAQSVGVNGSITSTGLAVQTSAGVNVLNADTTNMRLGVDVTYSPMTAPSGLTSTASSGGSLTSGQSYRYEVSAIDSANGETALSNEPAACAPSAGNLSCTLAWTASAGASGYRIYRTAAGGGSGTEKYLISSLKNAFTDSGAITLSANSPPLSSTLAYVPTNNSNNLNQLSIGGLGTPTGQAYVSGALPVDVSAGGVQTGSQPWPIYVQGKYAYVGDFNANKFQIFDVSNPVAPTDLTAGGVTTTGPPTSIFVQGHYLYVTDFTQKKFQIFDVSNPVAPTDVTAGGVNTRGFAYNIKVQGRYAYVLNNSIDKFQIFDVSNPAAPVDVSSGGVSTAAGAIDMYVQGRYLYVTSSTGNKLQVFDVSNPAAPVDVSSGGVSISGGTSFIFVQGRYAYVTSQTNNKFQVFDVSNPTTPVDITSGGVSTTNGAGYSFVQGRYIYICETGSKMQIFDISNPYKPSDISAGGVSNVGQPQGIYIQGRYAYVTDQNNNKLRVLDLGGAYVQQLEAGGAEVGSLAVDGNTNLAGDASVAGGLQVGQSAQISGNLATGGNLYVQGSTSFAGGILGGTTINSLSTPSAPTITSTGGNASSTNWSYTVTALSASGGETLASSAGSISASDNATLNGANFNTISWSAVSGARNYKVYRTVAGGTPNTTGLIATTSATNLNDTGLSASGASPTVNTTGNFTVNGSQVLFKSTTNNTTAFQVQNAAGSSVLGVDTANTLVSVDGGATYQTVAYNPATGFSSAVKYAVAQTGPTISADFNGDGKPDLATIPQTSTAVSVLMNNGDGTFAAKVDYALTQPSKLTAADFNGDGKPDLAVSSNSQSVVYVLMNNGDGTFAAPVTYSISSNPNGVAAADFNGDGKPDLVLGNYNSNAVAILLNKGNGTFNNAYNVSTGNHSYVATVADFNGDGKMDLATNNQPSNNFSILLGNGDGTFSSATNYAATFANDSAMVAADFNGDGKPDLASGTSTVGQVAVYMNNGDGTFSSAANYTSTYNYSITSADFNGDSKPDLATSGDAGTVSVLLNNGNGTFATKVDYAVSGCSTNQSDDLTSADFNGDSKPDLATSDCNDAVNRKIAVLINGASLVTTTHNATFSLTAPNATTTGIDIQAASGQTDDLLHLQNSSGTVLAAINSNGVLSVNSLDTTSSTTLNIGTSTATNVNIGFAGSTATVTSNLKAVGIATFQNAINAANAFQIQNTAGLNLLSADTSNMNVNVTGGNLLLNGVTSTNLIAISGSNQGGSFSGAAGTTYYYKVTTIIAGQETTASNEASFSSSNFNPLSVPAAPTLALAAGSNLGIGAYGYEVSFVTANGETTGGTIASITTTSGNQAVNLTAIPTGPTGTTARKIYRTVVGGSTYKLLTTLNDNSTTVYSDTTLDGSLGANVQVANTARTNTNNITVAWTAVPGATSYRVYRGTASGAESAYQSSATNSFTDTGSAGTTASMPTISPFGRIGIGTTAPTASLQVVGTSLFNGTNSNLFQIQTSTGSQALNVNTSTTPNLISNGDFESTTNGWSGKGTGTLLRNDTSAIGAAFGTGSLAVTTTAAANAGASFNYTLAPTTTYTLSLYARSSAGTVSTINIGHVDVSGTDVDCLTGQSITTTFTRFICTFTTGATITPPSSIYIKQSDATARTFYIDGVQLEQAATAGGFNSYQANLQVNTATNQITLDGSNSGALGPWSTNGNALPAERRLATSVTANGYVYEIGGYNQAGTVQSTVYYAKLNADGSTGAWQTNANALPQTLEASTSVTANGYLYAIGGFNTSTQSTVYYAKLNADGSTGAWQTNANALPDIRSNATSIVANGYVYVAGGYNGSSAQSIVYYAKLNADGSTGAWQTNANALPQILSGATSVTANGYMYEIGGCTGVTCSTQRSTVYYAKLNADGSTGAWSTNTNALPQTLGNATTVVVNGYMYEIGGYNGSNQSAVYYAKLNADGSTGIWQTSTNSLPAIREWTTSVTANGYVYAIGGSDGSSVQSTVYYASTSRIQLGGNLDLVGLQGGTLSDAGDQSLGSVGGSITAGNGLFVGSLQVQGATSLAQGLSVGGNLTANGSALFQSSANSSTAFQIQNSAGNQAVTVNTSNTPNLIANGDFESTTNGWSGKGSGTLLRNDTAAIGAAFGTGSLAVTTTAAANDGASFNYTLAPSTTYTLSLYARSSAGTVSTINIGRQDVSGTDVNCLTGQSITTTWTRFVCTFTTGGTITPPSSIYIKQSDATSRTFYIDGVQLEQASTASGFTSYQANLQVNTATNQITLDGSNSGALGPWSTNANSLPAVREMGQTVTANGYVYVLGGSNTNSTNGAQSTVYYAKLNADGSTGAWTTSSNPLPQTLASHTAVAYNGFIYVLGGINSSGTIQSTVYYAKLNADGSTGAWTTSSNPLTQTLDGATSVAANGYIYEMSGYNGTISQTTVYYAKLNADGSTGAWSSSANTLAQGLTGAASSIANGYVYVMGGTNTSSSRVSTVYYAKLNLNGSIGSWTTSTTPLPQAVRRGTTVVNNGYLYYIAGDNNGGTLSPIYYAKLNADGSTGAWQTNSNGLPIPVLFSSASVVANGYVYEMGGDSNSSTVSSVYYSSVSRVQIGANLDLVGLQGGTLSDPGDQSTGSVGGSITAGNGLFVGTLQVQGAASFAQGLGITGNLTSTGSVLFQNSADSTVALQVQNASGVSLFAVDTSNMTITLGAPSATPVILVLGNKNTAGDPAACTNGGIYYNSSSNLFRACNNGNWVSFADSTGWIGAGESWTYASADGHTFTFTVPADVTAKYSAGMRIKLTQSSTVEYFIVTGVSTYSGGVTTITIYGGQNYTLANSAISANYYSIQKSPVGFPLDPTIWTEQYVSTSQQVQSSPGSGYVNIGSASITIPIGAWSVSYGVSAEGVAAAFPSSGNGGGMVATTLSTGTTTESDSDFTAYTEQDVYEQSGAQPVITAAHNRSKNLVLSSKTTYFLNTKSNFGAGVATTYNRGDLAPTIIRAVCAYL